MEFFEDFDYWTPTGMKLLHVVAIFLNLAFFATGDYSLITSCLRFFNLLAALFCVHSLSKLWHL